MNPWINLTFAVAFGMSMLAVGIRAGRQRAMAMLALQLERGRVRLEAADGRSIPSSELGQLLGVPGRPTVASTLVVAALIAGCAGALLAFLLAMNGSR